MTPKMQQTVGGPVGPVTHPLYAAEAAAAPGRPGGAPASLAGVGVPPPARPHQGTPQLGLYSLLQQLTLLYFNNQCGKVFSKASSRDVILTVLSANKKQSCKYCKPERVTRQTALLHLLIFLLFRLATDVSRPSACSHAGLATMNSEHAMVHRVCWWRFGRQE